jgi:hypothetical protein
MKSIGIKFKL